VIPGLFKTATHGTHVLYIYYTSLTANTNECYQLHVTIMSIFTHITIKVQLFYYSCDHVILNRATTNYFYKLA